MLKNKNTPFTTRLSLAALVLIISIVLLITGCGQKPAELNLESGKQGTTQNGEQQPEISSKPVQTNVKVTLYFSDKEATYLVPIEKEITKGTETLESAIIAELIKGPQGANVSRTIPEGTKLLSVSVVNGVAYVNFSKEFKTKHGGGSAGETMTIYSVVNSLANLPGIQKVQFLLEGVKLESILGHNDTSIPFTPDWNLVGKTDSGRYVGQIDINSIEIKISGVPESQDPKVFRLGDEVRSKFDAYDLKNGEVIKFNYQVNAHGQSVITQISKLQN
jgi:spore germination protein GerM